ncbi:MFS transporter [Hwanghaeella grinnelliae]|uniref:MFS transporter n=1 Tax=Hwanghaeella grinnelliae TaxID=2500179 RepID=UPI0018747D54|nr:MFS transporter [Hwanghaeella grinnelliae]
MIEKLYDAVTGAGRNGAPKDRAEPLNGAIHVTSLSLTKIADGLINPKLVLAWLLQSVGAPGALIGLLVPVREAGALLPQLVLARWVEASARRKWFWVAGSLVQGAAAFGIAATAFFLDGNKAGWAIVGCLAVLSLGRASCSISQKDALARTIPKTRRGSITGIAGSVASLGILGFGIILAFGIIPLTVANIAGAVAVAGAAWFTGALIFSALRERADTPEKAESRVFSAFVAPFFDDAQLRRFVLARSLLTATALAPPFIVMLSAATEENRLGHLGPLVLASGAASIVSAYFWGRLSDSSSRKTLITAGALGSLTFAATGLADLMNAGIFGSGFYGMAASAGAIFFAQITHEGVRAGRKLHLTDMAGDENRARYTALSNSLIGLVLLLGGGLGSLADAAGPAWTLIALAGMCACAVPAGALLKEVQKGD